MAKKATKKKNPEEKPTEAIHIANKDGSKNVVGIGNLRVVLVEEDGGWFAQGLEIDYSAQGDTLEDARSNFECGLEATIDQHLKVYGSIAKILKPAPLSVWTSFLQSQSSHTDTLKFLPTSLIGTWIAHETLCPTKAFCI